MMRLVLALAVAAVLESHMDKKAEVTISPSSTAAGLLPTQRRMRCATRFPNPEFSTAAESANPPRSKATTGWKKGARASLVSNTPSTT